jgi:Zn-dependent protease with chaperone function
VITGLAVGAVTALAWGVPILLVARWLSTPLHDRPAVEERLWWGAIIGVAVGILVVLALPRPGGAATFRRLLPLGFSEQLALRVDAPVLLAIAHWPGARVLALVWGGIALLLIGYTVARTVAVLRSLRRRPDASTRHTQILERVVGSGSSIRLTVSDRTLVPLAVGASEVCLPADLTDFSDREIEVLIRHEVAHLRRGDPLKALLLGVFAALLFPVPGVRTAHRRLLRCAEMRSDESAASGSRQARALASALERLASRVESSRDPIVRSPFGSAAADGGGRSLVLDRVARLLSDPGHGRRAMEIRGWRNQIPVLMIVLIPVLLFVAPVLGVHLRIQDRPQLFRSLDAVAPKGSELRLNRPAKPGEFSELRIRR